MNEHFTHDIKVMPVFPPAKEIAESIINLMKAQEKLQEAVRQVPSYNVYSDREDYYAEEQEKWNRSADTLYSLLFPKKVNKKDESEKNYDPLIRAMQNLIDYAERQICPHDHTHRGGAIWEICDDCGKKWADDEGGKPKEFHFPKEIENAQRILDLYTYPLKDQH